MPPFLTIVTRTCRRPVMLSACIESVLAQTCHDLEQIFIVDQIGKHPEGNILWANRQFAANKHRIDGQYVFMLDDDGVLIQPDFVATVKALATDEGYPDVVLVKSLSLNHKGKKVQFPLSHVWDIAWELGERPAKWAGHGYNEVVKANVWKACIEAYDVARGGDWHFMTRLIATGATFARCDVLSAQSTMRGRGNVFEDCGRDWWQAIVAEYRIVNLGDNDWRLRL